MGYLTISTNVRRYQTYHRWQFFSFRKIAHRCIVCVTQSNWVKYVIFVFPHLARYSAEAQVIWGGIVKRRLIAYFIGNISAKKYQNPFMCIKVIASHRWDVFLVISHGSCCLQYYYGRPMECRPLYFGHVVSFYLSIFLSIFFPRRPNISGRRLDVYHTYGVALVRI